MIHSHNSIFSIIIFIRILCKSEHLKKKKSPRVMASKEEENLFINEQKLLVVRS